MRFYPHNTMVELVDYDYNVLPLMSRFAIPLGFNNATIRDVCRMCDIDVNVFLLIINYQISGVIEHELLSSVSPDGIADFLQRSHDYFIDYKFPHIRKNLIAALDPKNDDVNPSIVKFYDDYTRQALEHFMYEEQNVFPYVHDLSNGATVNYDITIFERNHDELGCIISELKNIILRYYRTSLPDLMYDVLVDLYNCQEDIDKHADIENSILIPLVRQLEASRS